MGFLRKSLSEISEEMDPKIKKSRNGIYFRFHDNFFLLKKGGPKK